jgi:hypothetical protein
MGVQIMKYRATGDCRTPNYKVLGSIAAYEHATAELNLGARSLCIVGGYSGWDWVSIILVEELYDLIVLNFCQNPPSRFFLLLVYYIIILRQICWKALPEYVPNGI